MSIHDARTGAFTSSFNLTFLDQGDGDPVFPSPNGDLFAAIVQGEELSDPTSLVVVNGQGAVVKHFPGIRSAAWMPDGRLVFTGQDTGGIGVLGVFPDVENNNAFNEIATFSGPFDDLPYSLAVSPNGSEIAYTYNSHLWVQPFGGGAARLVAQSTVNVPLTGAAFLPDGQYIAFKMGWPEGFVHVLPNHHGAPVLVDPNDATRLHDAQGGSLQAWHQLYWAA